MNWNLLWNMRKIKAILFRLVFLNIQVRQLSMFLAVVPVPNTVLHQLFYSRFALMGLSGLSRRACRVWNLIICSPCQLPCCWAPRSRRWHVPQAPVSLSGDLHAAWDAFCGHPGAGASGVRALHLQPGHPLPFSQGLPNLSVPLPWPEPPKNPVQKRGEEQLVGSCLAAFCSVTLGMLRKVKFN